jgi:DNA-binding transcriptional MerR regulator
MRVKELADLSGRSVRLERYYHQIGLLPVPENQVAAERCLAPS